MPLRSDAGARRRPLISLTPLIDVVFILLVFFMLASSFLDWRAIDLRAPEASKHGGGAGETVVLKVLPDRLLLDGQVVAMDAATEILLRRVADREGRDVQLRPAPGVTVQRVADVLDALSVAGLRDLTIVRGADARPPGGEG